LNLHSKGVKAITGALVGGLVVTSIGGQIHVDHEHVRLHYGDAELLGILTQHPDDDHPESPTWSPIIQLAVTASTSSVSGVLFPSVPTR
jgi:hypothetical protein